MLAKIVNTETKQCDVFLGTDIEWAKAQGFEELEIEQAFNMQWYLKGYAPEKPAPTKDEIKQMRIDYRHANIDNQTLERNRKMANGTWTQEDEAEYLALDAEVTAYIEEHLPYPTDSIVEE